MKAFFGMSLMRSRWVCTLSRVGSYKSAFTAFTSSKSSVLIGLFGEGSEKNAFTCLHQRRVLTTFVVR